MEHFNVVGDVAGEYETLLALLAKMPKDAELLCLGDPNDRGPDTKSTIEFLMKNGHTVQSNHAHMMTEEWHQQANPGVHPYYYDVGLWPQKNGGPETMLSYCEEGLMWDIHKYIPKKHIDFLQSCPLYIESENYIFTHAPIKQDYTLEQACDLGNGFAGTSFMTKNVCQYTVLWNRHVPKKPNPHLKGKINIFGHNSSSAPKIYTTEFPSGIKIDQARLNILLGSREQHPIYGICLDTSAAQVLTGLHLPSMTLYQQEYIR